LNLAVNISIDIVAASNQNIWTTAWGILAIEAERSASWKHEIHFAAINSTFV